MPNLNVVPIKDLIGFLHCAGNETGGPAAAGVYLWEWTTTVFHEI